MEWAEEGKKNEAEAEMEGHKDMEEAEGRARSLSGSSRYGRTRQCLEEKRGLGNQAWQELASGLGWGAAGQSCLGHGLSSLTSLLLESLAAHLTPEELLRLWSLQCARHSCGAKG